MDIVNGAMLTYGTRDVNAARNIQKSSEFKINGDYF